MTQPEPDRRASIGLLAAAWVSLAFTYAGDALRTDPAPPEPLPQAIKKGPRFNWHRFGRGVAGTCLIASAAARIHENRAQKAPPEDDN